MNHIQDLVLNTLILCPETWVEHGMHLTRDDFTGERREIFAAIRKRATQSQAIDYGILLTEVAEVPGGAAAVDAIGSAGTASHTLGQYIEELQTDSVKRKAEQIGLSLMNNGDIAAARKALDSLYTGKAGFTDGQAASAELLAEFERKAANPDSGIKTKLHMLDRLVTLEPGNLCIVAARPGMGKTTLAINIARRCGVPFGFFSLEMSKSELMGKMVAMEGVDYGRVVKPHLLKDDDWPKITATMDSTSNQGLWINDTGGLSIDALESDAYRMVRENGARLLVVDYLQLVRCKAESRYNEVSEVSRRLKALAKNLDIPLIAVSQLNRRTDTGGNPVPRVADLRESGQLEQDADQIIFIFRPEMYVKGDRPGEADLIVEKNRAGETGIATVGWQGKYQRFVDLTYDNYPRAVA